MACPHIKFSKIPEGCQMKLADINHLKSLEIQLKNFRLQSYLIILTWAVIIYCEY